MNLHEWCDRWHIPHEALAELAEIDDSLAPQRTITTEQGAQNNLRLQAQKLGGSLWRNNNGASKTENGFIRFGLANDSHTLNAKFKSSDLIGLIPITVTESMVGRVIGRFVAREVKKPGWRYRGTDREIAQLAFINYVNSLGGDARFSTGEL